MSFESLFWNRAFETLVVFPWLPWYSLKRWWTFCMDELPPTGPVFSLQYLLRLYLIGDMFVIYLLAVAWPAPIEIYVASD